MKVFYKYKELPNKYKELLAGIKTAEEEKIAYYPSSINWGFYLLAPIAVLLFYFLMTLVISGLVAWEMYWAKFVSMFSEAAWLAILVLVLSLIPICGILAVLYACFWVLMMLFQDIRTMIAKKNGRNLYGIWLTDEAFLWRKKDIFRRLSSFTRKTFVNSEKLMYRVV